MPCKKSELVQAVNTYGNARASADPNLVNFASNLLAQFMDTLEFDPEPEPTEAVEATEE